MYILGNENGKDPKIDENDKKLFLILGLFPFSFSKTCIYTH